ncbi:MAG: methionine--tRNA ligase, partial [Dehalococcoidia bacterium]
TMLYPFMPFSSQKVHRFLGLSGEVERAGWKLERPVAGQPLQKPAPLFLKLDEEAVTKEMTGAGV